MIIPFNQNHFESLKKLTLCKANLASPTPANCKILSLLIERKTNVRISETTMKRVFGFAFTKFCPSYFTLDVISKFCDFQNWENFCESQELLLENDIKPAKSNGSVRHTARKITQCTLQSLQNKSGVPYSQTIKRRFINDHFEVFLEGSYSATAFAAPAGYGKTIALCHWVEEMVAENEKKGNNDIILFLNVNVFITAYFNNQDLNEWLLALLGYSKDDDIAQIIESDINGKIILIIDGLDEYILKDDHFHLLLNQVFDILSIYKSHPAFKLVLTMRNSSLVNYSDLLHYDEEFWFKGFVTSEDNLTNVPLFNMCEINQLCNKINPCLKHHVKDTHLKLISQPLYFQFFYKNNKENFSLERIDHLSRYELVSAFILNKIYLGSTSEKKVLLLNAFCECLDLKKQNYNIDKISVFSQIERYKTAYLELLGIGFIREQNISDGFRYQNIISFGNNDFLSFTIARHLLTKNENVFGEQLIDNINSITNSCLKTSVLKWQLLFAVRDHQPISFDLLKRIELDPKEKFNIIIFTSALLRKEFNNPVSKQYVIELFKSKENEVGLLTFFLGLEFIQPEYKSVLSGFLDYELSNSDDILIHCNLAILALIELNLNQLEEHLTVLKSFAPDDFWAFSFNPLAFLEFIFNYFKFGIVEPQALSVLANCFFDTTNHTSAKDVNTLQILCLLRHYTITICKTRNQFSAWYNNEQHKVLPRFADCEFDLLLQVCAAETKLALNKTEEGLSLYRKASAVYEKNKTYYTPLVLASFYLLRLKVMLLLDQKEHILQDMQAIMRVSDEYGYKLIKLKCLTFLMTNEVYLELNADMVKNIRHELIKVTRENSLSLENQESV